MDDYCIMAMDEHDAGFALLAVKRFIGCIANTCVDDSVLDEEGRVDFSKMRPICYDSTRRIYRVIGEEVGGAWDAGKAPMWKTG